MKSNKRKAVRDMLCRMGMQATPAEVVSALGRYGIEVSARFVVLVRSEMIRDQARAERHRSKKDPGVKSRKRPWQRKIPGWRR
jgi:hypothetical protein